MNLFAKVVEVEFLNFHRNTFDHFDDNWYTDLFRKSFQSDSNVISVLGIGMSFHPGYGNFL